MPLIRHELLTVGPGNIIQELVGSSSGDILHVAIEDTRDGIFAVQNTVRGGQNSLFPCLKAVGTYRTLPAFVISVV